MANMISLILFLLLTLTPLSNSKVFESINCGSAADSYTDINTIRWTSDKTLIQEGESFTVPIVVGLTVPMMTLRAFTAGIIGKKYCYRIEAEKGGKTLLRARFYYGNYDGRMSPPSFAVFADGNLWSNLKFTAVFQDLRLEAIYVPTRDFISLCVVQTFVGQFPFVSTIEVRSLGPEMYGRLESNRALLLQDRFAFGAIQTGLVFRYPNDLYDRIWTAVSTIGDINVINVAPTIEINTEDNPPEIVLRRAITRISASEPLSSSDLIISETETPVYINMYFSEVTRLASTLKRSFVITVDDKVVSDPIVPPYGSVIQRTLTNITASSRTKLALVPTKDSTLAPLINAMEIYYVSGPLLDVTNNQDIDSSQVNRDSCLSSISCTKETKSIKPSKSGGTESNKFLIILVAIASSFFALVCLTVN